MRAENRFALFLIPLGDFSPMRANKPGQPVHRALSHISEARFF
jgi:hypothetical protein